MKFLYNFEDHNSLTTTLLGRLDSPFNHPNVILCRHTNDTNVKHDHCNYHYDSKVEWIANPSGGTCYINTGIKGSGTQRVECVFMPITNTTAWNCVYGARDNAGSKDGIYIYSNNSNNGQTTKGYLGYYNSTLYNSTTFFASNNTKHTIIQNEGTFIKDGVMLQSWTTTSFTCSKATIFIFDANNNGSRGNYNGYFRLYSFKLWNNNVLVRDYIPVRIGTIGYLYDKINNKLYGNAGGSSFTVGDDVKEKIYDSKIEYLESTGTQYINTGVIPKAANFGFDADIVVVALPSDISSLIGSRNATNASGSHSYNAFLTTDGWIRADMLGTATNMVQITAGNHINISYRPSTTNINSTSQSNSTKTDCSYPFYIFTHNNAGSLFARSVKQRIYSLKLYINNILICDFIPVRKGNIGYMYDKISEKLYGNAGTGNFILGPDIN